MRPSGDDIAGRGPARQIQNFTSQSQCRLHARRRQVRHPHAHGFSREQETAMQNEPHPIRRLPGGAIDIDHYSRRGARLRSDAAWATLAGMAAAVGGLRAQRARRG
jgi:hypothetical protein